MAGRAAGIHSVFASQMHRRFGPAAVDGQGNIGKAQTGQARRGAARKRRTALNLGDADLFVVEGKIEVGANGGLNVARDLLGRPLGADQHMQLVHSPGGSEDGAYRHDIFELTHYVFNLLGRNVAARNGDIS